MKRLQSICHQLLPLPVLGSLYDRPSGLSVTLQQPWSLKRDPYTPGTYSQTPLMGFLWQNVG